MQEYRVFFLRILICSLVILSITVAISLWQLSAHWQRIDEATLQRALETQIRMLELQTPDGAWEEQIDGLQDLCDRMRDFSDAHVTIMRWNGDVLADSHTKAWRLMNQSSQPEMINAKKTEERTGFVLRPDPDTGVQTYYLVKRITREGSDRGYIRVSVPRGAITGGYSRLLAFLVFLVLSGALILGWGISRRVIPPVRTITRNADLLTGDIHAKWSGTDEKTREFEHLNRALKQMISRFKDRLKEETLDRRQLETMFDSMVDAVMVIDSQECILRYNEAARALFIPGVADVSGRTVLEVIRNTRLHQFIRKTLSRNGHQEDEIVFHGREDRSYKATGVAIEQGDGVITGAMIVLHDLTRIRKLERIRKDFVANVSHELKTPITAIRGFVETLLDGDMAENRDAQRFLQIILKQTNQLNTVVEDLLSLSRLEQDSAGGSIDIESLELGDVLKAAVAVCTPHATDRDVTINIDTAPGTVQCNRTLLQQAVINLIDNAVKYGPDHSEIIVSGTFSGPVARISVIDHGPGIPVEFQERIFERFYRLDKSRSRDLGGSGLGLSIVKHIAQAHRGRVEVSSVPGQGSVFTIELPLNKTNHAS